MMLKKIIMKTRKKRWCCFFSVMLLKGLSLSFNTNSLFLLKEKHVLCCCCCAHPLTPNLEYSRYSLSTFPENGQQGIPFIFLHESMRERVWEKEYENTRERESEMQMLLPPSFHTSSCWVIEPVSTKTAIKTLFSFKPFKWEGRIWFSSWAREAIASEWRLFAIPYMELKKKMHHVKNVKKIHRSQS